jgi:hypothetical protein
VSGSGWERGEAVRWLRKKKIQKGGALCCWLENRGNCVEAGVSCCGEDENGGTVRLLRGRRKSKTGGGRRLLLFGVRDRFRFRLFFLYFFLCFQN